MNMAMQLTAHATRCSVFSDDDVSCKHDGFYGHVLDRGGVPRVFGYGTLA